VVNGSLNGFFGQQRLNEVTVGNATDTLATPSWDEIVASKCLQMSVEVVKACTEARHAAESAPRTVFWLTDEALEARDVVDAQGGAQACTAYAQPVAE